MESLKDIEECYGREDVFKALKEHGQRFNLESFYVENIGYNYVMNTGFRLISTNQIINCFCVPYTGTHEKLIENVLYAMSENYNEVYKKNNYEWRKTCVDLGVIAFQLISNHYTLIWMPNKINRFQYNAFMETYKEICELRSKYNINVSFMVSIIKSGNDYDTMGIDEAASYIKNIVSDEDFCYEEYNLDDGKLVERI